MPLKCGENKLGSTAGATRMGNARQAAEDAAKATVKHDAQGVIDSFINQECPSDCPRKEVFADEDTGHGAHNFGQHSLFFPFLLPKYHNHAVYCTGQNGSFT